MGVLLKPVRWSPHALDNLADREIDRETAEKTLSDPELVVPGQSPRLVLMRRYFDRLLQQEMLIRMIVEDTGTERVVITVYKTSQISKSNHKSTPILVLTTESETEKKNLAREAGATGWMVKPFDPDRLVATVRKVAP